MRKWKCMKLEASSEKCQNVKEKINLKGRKLIFNLIWNSTFKLIVVLIICIYFCCTPENYQKKININLVENWFSYILFYFFQFK